MHLGSVALLLAAGKRQKVFADKLQVPLGCPQRAVPQRSLNLRQRHSLFNPGCCLNRPGFAGDSTSRDIGVMGQAKKYSPEVRERAVRLVFEHEREYASQWAAIQSIAAKIGCSGETLRSWVRQAERDLGKRPGPTTAERERIKELERENRELRRANEILRKAAAFFAQAGLDRRPG